MTARDHDHDQEIELDLDDELVKVALSAGHQMFLGGEIDRAEAVSAPSIRSAIAAFIALGVVRRGRDALELAGGVPRDEHGGVLVHVLDQPALVEMVGANKQAEQLLGIMRQQMIQVVMRAGAKPPANDPTKPPEMTWRDYLIMLLHIGAELEHGRGAAERGEFFRRRCAADIGDAAPGERAGARRPGECAHDQWRRDPRDAFPLQAPHHLDHAHAADAL